MRIARSSDWEFYVTDLTIIRQTGRYFTLHIIDAQTEQIAHLRYLIFPDVLKNKREAAIHHYVENLDESDEFDESTGIFHKIGQAADGKYSTPYHW